MENKKAFLQGNEACTLGAIHAGIRFFAGYPITPSTEIAEIAAAELPKYGGKFIQMEDEIAGMAATLGGSLSGLKSLTATSGPGFSLKQELIGYASICEIPCVIINVQRGGPSTGLPTSPAQGEVMQSRWGSHGDRGVIVLSPSTVPECYTLAMRAVNFAEKYMTPVILLTDEIVGHMREQVIFEEVKEPEVFSRKMPTCKPEEYLPFKPEADQIPAIAPFGQGYRFHVTGLTHDEEGFATMDPKKVEPFNERLVHKFDGHRDDIVSCEEYMTEDAEYIIVAYGAIARTAKEAINVLRAEGIKVGLFRPITIWPFPDTEYKALAERVKGVIVPEMNSGQLVIEIDRLTAGKCPVVSIADMSGEIIAPDKIVEGVRGLTK